MESAERPQQVGVMVAHPDDEVLWAGGTLLLHPHWRCRIATLCRGGDPDRAPKFHRVQAALRAEGAMADLDDGPAQRPLPDALLRQTILALLGGRDYDLLLTHSPRGEYTRHRRHEETGRTVMALWAAGALRARALWLFAYADGGRAYLPRAIAGAHRATALPPAVWAEKYRLIHELYGFAADSWEARATPRVEAFWQCTAPADVPRWQAQMKERREDLTAL